MAKRVDKWSVTLARYEDPAYRFILRLGPGRFSLNLGHWSLIIELWFLRNGGLHSS